MSQPRMPRSFLLVWLAHLISSLGSGLTAFALGIWVYQRTGSAAAFTSIVLSAALPGVLLLPFAGAFVDRWDRRKVLIYTELFSGLCIAAMIALMQLGVLQVWQICMLSGIGACCGAFEWPALTVASTILVPKEQRGQANGMIQLAQASAFILSPLLAGFLLPIVTMGGLLFADAISYGIAVATLLFTPFPKVVACDVAAPARSLLREMRDGWRYISSRPGLLGMTMLFAALNFPLSVAQVLLTPLVLGFAGTAASGSVMAAYGVALVGGGIAVSVRGVPQKRVQAILIVLAVQALALVVCGLHANAVLVGVAVFVMAAGIPLQTAANQELWQQKVPVAIQGRTFSVRRMLGQLSVPVAYLCAGRWADQVFEPLLARHGALAGTVGSVIGTGRGRGVALLVMLMGVVLLGIAAIAGLMPLFRSLETTIPDVAEQELAA